MIDTAVSACSIVTTRGGARRTLRSPHVRVSRPRRKHAVLQGLGGVVVRRVETDHQAAAADLLDERPLRRPARGAPTAGGRRPWRRCRRARTRRAASVAFAAAQATGLPPNVEPWPPGSQSISSARATMPARGRPLARPLPTQRMSGSTPSCSQAHIVPVRPTPDCTSSSDEEDAVAVAELAQGGQPAGRRHDVAAFALDRLDEDRRHVGRIGELLEQHLARCSRHRSSPARRRGSSTERGSCPG